MQKVKTQTYFIWLSLCAWAQASLFYLSRVFNLVMQCSAVHLLPNRVDSTSRATMCVCVCGSVLALACVFKWQLRPQSCRNALCWLNPEQTTPRGHWSGIRALLTHKHPFISLHQVSSRDRCVYLTSDLSVALDCCNSSKIINDYR